MVSLLESAPHLEASQRFLSHTSSNHTTQLSRQLFGWLVKNGPTVDIVPLDDSLADRLLF